AAVPPGVLEMNGYVGLRDDRRDGERLAARIGLLFPGPSAAWLQRAERLRRQQALGALQPGRRGAGEQQADPRRQARAVATGVAQADIAVHFQHTR
ncbi:hypothetical protein, partial [Pseudomonas aeruginosa]